MQRRDILAGGALVLGVLIVGVALFSPASDDEKIAAVLEDLADAVSFQDPIESPISYGSQLSGRFQDIFSEPVDIRVSEISSSIPQRWGQRGIAAAQVMSRLGSFHAEFSDLDIQVSGDWAKVHGNVSIVAKDSGQLRRGKRSVSLKFEKNGGSWLIQELRVERDSD